jgi:hypothetical protein
MRNKKVDDPNTTIPTHVQEVWGFNSGLKTGYPDQAFS